MRGKEAAFPKGWQGAKGIVTGVTSLEAIAWERKGGKEGLYCMGLTMLFAGARQEGYIQVRYARRGGHVILYLMLSRIGKVKEGEQEF